MFPRHDYKNKCWWCGNTADSQEHKYKKSDLVREFGKVSDPKGYAVRLIGGEEMRTIQGPKSKEVKFDTNLCQYCNNTRSQPFDRAYDIFTDYINKKEFDIIKFRQFSFSKIFENDWKTKRDNLFRYFIKHICCWLASYKIWIAPEITDYLNGAPYMQYIQLKFDICLDPVVILRAFDIIEKEHGHLSIGNMTCHFYNDRKYVNELKSSIGYRSIRCSYIYDSKILTNSKYNADIDTVSLQLSTNLNFHEFKNFVGNVLEHLKNQKNE